MKTITEWSMTWNLFTKDFLKDSTAYEFSQRLKSPSKVLGKKPPPLLLAKHNEILAKLFYMIGTNNIKDKFQ